MTTHADFKSLIDEHETIRAGIKQMVGHLSDGFWQTASEGREAIVVQTRGRLPESILRNVRWGLFYLIEGLKGHLERDLELVMPLAPPEQERRFEREHETVRALAEGALTLVTDLVEQKPDAPGFDGACQRLRTSIEALQRLIEEHTLAEDGVLRAAMNEKAEPTAAK